jgi:hydrophobic/amphiphilic exporter-1 (mainly G- bacteria), HAE1 family
MSVQKQSGQNTVAVAEGIREEVARINQQVPGVRLTVLSDSSVFISRSIAAVKEAAWLGAILVVGIIFFFLREIRATVIICISIPISIIGTFALLYFGGFTLNTMTFGGLALGVGMIVDASIVVLENTFRHMEKGKSRVQAAIDGAEEVWSAIVASTLTHIAVFVPLLFLVGVSSIMFKQLAIVVMFALVMSLFVAVTVVPVCARGCCASRFPPTNAAASVAVSSTPASAPSTRSTTGTGACSTGPSSTGRRSSGWERRPSSWPSSCCPPSPSS